MMQFSFSQAKTHYWTVGATALLAVCLNVCPALAQPQRTPSHRDLVVNFQRAVQLLESDEPRRGIASLHQVLLGLSEKDDVLIPTDAGTQRSLKLECMKLLRSMSDDDLQFYEQQFGPEAQAQLQTARKTNDLDLLESVSRRFFLTQAGIDATRELALRKLDRGAPLDAALALTRLQSQARKPEQFEPELSALMAIAWSRAGVPEEAARVLDRVSDNGRSDVKTNVGVLTIQSGKWPDWLPSQTDVGTIEWPMHRGNMQRVRTSEPIVPIWEPLWRANVLETLVVETPSDQAAAATGFERMKVLLEEYRNLRERQRLPAIPAPTPLVLRDRVLFRTPLTVKSVRTRKDDLYEAGELEWESYKPDPMVLATFRRDAEIRDAVQASQIYGYIDRTSGTMASDGRFLYVIEETDRLPSQRIRQRFDDQSPGGEPNFLRAYELSSGSIAWQIGGEQGIRVAGMRDAVFLGPPMPFGSDLLLIAASRDELRLLQLHVNNPTSPQPEIRLVWSQRLSQVATEIPLDNGARLSGLTPAYSNGVLVCPTGLGELVGIDPSSQSLLWKYRYPTRPAFDRASRNSIPQIVDDLVIWAPPGLDSICCLNLQTGEERWSVRQNYTQWFGVNERFVVSIVGDKLKALLTTNGRPAWSESVQLRQATGHGLLHGDTVSIPQVGGVVTTIDVQTGRVLATSKSPVELGNLVAVGNMIISQSPTEVVAFRGFKSIDQELTRQLRSDPLNPKLLIGRATQQLQADNLTAGLTTLRKAADQASGGAAADLLVDTVTSLEGDQLRDHIGLLDGIKPSSNLAAPLASTGMTGPVQLLSRTLSPLQNQSQLRIQLARFRAIKTLSRDQAKDLLRPLIDLANQMRPYRIVVGDSRMMAEPRYLASLVRRMLSETSANNRNILVETLEDYIVTVARLRKLKTAMRILEWLESPSIAVLETVATAAEDIEAGTAASLLQTIRDRDDVVSRVKATERLIRQLASTRQDRVRGLIEDLGLDAKQDSNAADAMERLRADPKLASLTNASNAWPAGDVQVRVSEPQDSDESAFEPRRSVASLGETRGSWSFYFRGDRTIGIDQQLQTQFDAKVSPFGSGISQRDAYVLETPTTLIVPGADLLAFDLLSPPGQPRVLWTARLRPPMVMQGQISRARYRPVGPLKGNTLLIGEPGRLVARHVRTGHVLWSREIDLTNASLHADEDILAIVGPNRVENYSMFDGRWLETRPLNLLPALLLAEIDRGQVVARPDASGLEVSFVNFGEANPIWSQKFSRETMFSRPVRGYFAAFDPAGSVQIFRLKDGRRVANARCEPRQRSGRPTLHITPDAFVVLTTPPSRVFSRPRGDRDDRVAIGIDRSNGTRLWEKSIGASVRVPDGDFETFVPRRYAPAEPLGPNLPVLLLEEPTQGAVTYRIIDCRTGETLHEAQINVSIRNAIARSDEPGVLRLKLDKRAIVELQFRDE